MDKKTQWKLPSEENFEIGIAPHCEEEYLMTDSIWANFQQRRAEQAESDLIELLDMLESLNNSRMYAADKKRLINLLNKYK